MTGTIKLLTTLQQYYHRPGYILGQTETPDTLLKEMIDNASDELMNQFCDRVEIITKPKEGYYTVRDNGRGLPTEKFHTDNPDMSHLNGEISAKLIFSKENSSGKYDKELYPYSAGSNGIGCKAMNVFSTKTHIRVKDTKKINKGKVYELILGWDKDRNQTYQENWLDPKTISDFWWSTEVTVYPNPVVFESMIAKPREIPLQVLKGKYPNIKITINDKEIQPFSFSTTIEHDLISDKVLSTKITYGTTIIDLMFGWCLKSFTSYYRGTVNSGTSNEGLHINACRKAVGIALAKFNPSLTASDGEYSLRLFADSLIYYPSYGGQTKEKLVTIGDFKAYNITNNLTSKDANWQSQAGLEEALANEIYKVLKKEEQFTNLVIGRLIEYKKSINQLSDEGYIRDKIKTGSDKVSRVSVKGVVEATSADRRKCELYLCEGKSAGGPIKDSRNREFQALFELRGKPMNVANAESAKEIVDNEEIRTVINAVGIGMNPNVKIEDARYGKIIIATDADADGEHIQGLVLGALCFLCPEVFTGIDGDSMVYIAHAPLYKQNNKFIYEENELNNKADFKRFKSLGSMLTEDLKKTVVDQKSRRLKKITLDSEELESALTLITSSAAKKALMVENGLLIE